jgi:hypothetical protein
MPQDNKEHTGRVTSRIENLRSMEPAERLAAAARAAGLEVADIAALGEGPVLPMTIANGMIENVIGRFELPLGVASNFTVNGRGSRAVAAALSPRPARRSCARRYRCWAWMTRTPRATGCYRKRMR